MRLLPPPSRGFVLLLASAPASERATELPLAFTINYSPHRLTTGFAAVACLAAPRLHGGLMTAWPSAYGPLGKNLCCVTTRGRNLWLFGGLWRRCGTLTARPFGLGVLGFDLVLLTAFGLPPRRLPAPDQPQTFGILAVTLVVTPWLVRASTALAQADPRPWSSAMTIRLMMTMAHGSVFSQGTVRGERGNVLLGRLLKARSQSILACMNQTGKETV